MRELKLDIIFWDGEDPETIEHLTAEEAWAENYIEFKGNTLVATDECTIVREYTGLKDKNGKEIYEGDILRHFYKGIKSVFYDEEEGCFGVEGTYLTRQADGEIIGNIYENKELINE